MASTTIVPQRARQHPTMFFRPGEWGERLVEHGVVRHMETIPASIGEAQLIMLAQSEALSRTVGEAAWNITRLFISNTVTGSVSYFSAMSCFINAHSEPSDYESVPLVPSYTVRAKLNWLPRAKPLPIIDD
jgi:hypothetical protein